MIISIDFDGTIVEHLFPRIGNLLPDALEVITELQEAGHKIVLNTCREGIYLDEAVKFCEEKGIIFRSVNCNHKEDDFRENGGRKVFAHIYIDDRNLNGFPGWKQVRKALLSG
jgi:hypothetical protein